MKNFIMECMPWFAMATITIVFMMILFGGTNRIPSIYDGKPYYYSDDEVKFSIRIKNFTPHDEDVTVTNSEDAVTIIIRKNKGGK